MCLDFRTHVLFKKAPADAIADLGLGTEVEEDDGNGSDGDFADFDMEDY